MPNAARFNLYLFLSRDKCLALKNSLRLSVIPRAARNLNLPRKSEMSRFRYASLDMTSCFYCASDSVINFAYPLTYEIHPKLASSIKP